MIARLENWLRLQTDKRPDACAAVFNHRRISYGDLELASNQLAQALRSAGCEHGDREVLLLPKCIEALIGMFGAMKADCIYVPMDTASPAARQKRILDQCESRSILALESTAPLLDSLVDAGAVAPSTRIGWMDRAPTTRAAGSNELEFTWDDVRRVPDWILPSHRDPPPAHILFTSGSTGAPKGVIITHSNVIQFVEWAVRYFEINNSDRVSCHSPLYFDLSMFDIYGSVATGSEVHLLTPELNLLPHRLADDIRTAQLTQWFSVPSVLNLMAKSNAVRHEDFPELRRLLWCGEKLPVPTLIHWMRRLPHVSFDNLYGPTETTIASSYYRVPRCPENESVEIPIGGPCAGEQLWVLDQNLRPLPTSETGGLYISGVGLSPGYWRDPEKTSRAFLNDPFRIGPHSKTADGEKAPERIYRTGGLARVGQDGLFYLLGGVDTQIKSRGYRIELGEIEAAIHAVPEVRDAVVVAVGSSGFEGATICCAYVASPLLMMQDALRREPLQFALGLGGPNEVTTKLLRALRWDVWPVPFYFRVLNGRRFLEHFRPLRNNRATGLLMDAAAGSGLAWAGVQAAGLLSRFRKKSAAEVQRVEYFSTWADRVWEAAQRAYPVLEWRDSAVLNDLFGGRPELFCLQVCDGGRVAGWAVIDRVSSAQNQFGEMLVCSILDCLSLPQDAEMVIEAATEYLSRMGADLIISYQVHPAWQKALRHAGYFPRRSTFLFASSPELTRRIKAAGATRADLHFNRGGGDVAVPWSVSRTEARLWRQPAPERSLLPGTTSGAALMNGFTMPQDELTQAIRRLFAEKMLVEVRSVEEDLIQGGALDSLRLAELLAYLEEEIGFRVPMEDLEIEDLRSVASIARMIGRQRARAHAERATEVGEVQLVRARGDVSINS